MSNKSTLSDRYILWSDINLDYDDWKEYLEEEYPDLTDDERYYIMIKNNGEYLEDVRFNLDVQLSQPILVIADIGRWNGRFSGYKEISSENISDCFYSNADMAEWFVDRYGDLRADTIHHDGTNHYLYRVYKDNVTDCQKDNLKAKIYDGKATRADITRITKRLGDDIAKIYGFNIPRLHQQKAGK